MKIHFTLIALAAMTFLILAGLNSSAQTRPKATPDPEIQKMVREVSAKNIEATIRKLGTFGTRNTLSSQTDPNRGIGAARDWIYGEFQKISNDCGGCLDVQK